MNSTTNFTATEREYQAAVEASSKAYGLRRFKIKRGYHNPQHALTDARRDYERQIHRLREKFGVDKDGREPSNRPISLAKAYAPSHGGYPGTVR